MKGTPTLLHSSRADREGGCIKYLLHIGSFHFQSQDAKSEIALTWETRFNFRFEYEKTVSQAHPCLSSAYLYKKKLSLKLGAWERLSRSPLCLLTTLPLFLHSSHNYFLKRMYTFHLYFTNISQDRVIWRMSPSCPYNCPNIQSTTSISLKGNL